MNTNSESNISREELKQRIRNKTSSAQKNRKTNHAKAHAEYKKSEYIKKKQEEEDKEETNKEQ